MKIWGWPLAIGVLSVAGLISALLGDGIWDTLSWFALGAPVATLTLYILRPSGV